MKGRRAQCYQHSKLAYPPEIKHGWLENEPFISWSSQLETSIHFGDFPASHGWWNQRVCPLMCQYNPLYIHYTSTMYPLYIHYTSAIHPLYIHYISTIHPLYIHYTSTIYPLYIIYPLKSNFPKLFGGMLGITKKGSACCFEASQAFKAWTPGFAFPTSYWIFYANKYIANMLLYDAYIYIYVYSHNAI